MLDHLWAGLELIMDPFTLLLILVAAFYGLFMGAVPGLTATMATVLLIPFTMFLEPMQAIAMIITLSALAIYSGDLPGALLKIPGTPASAAYVDDTYFLAKKGHATGILGLGLVSSAIGGVIGVLALMIMAPALAGLARNFTTYEYFWIAVLGVSASVFITRGNQIKGGISLLLGVGLSTIGLDIVSGYPRFTFGADSLLSGLNFIVVMVGVFGLAEVLNQARLRKIAQSPIPVSTKGILRRGWSLSLKMRGELLKGSVIGVGIGALPGAGSDVAAWVAYGTGKAGIQRSKRPDLELEKIDLRPYTSASASNNSSLGTTLVPAMVLGIPGDSITAILLGVLITQGLLPGPQLFHTQGDLVAGIYWVVLIANILMLFCGVLAIKAFSKVLSIPRAAMMAIIVAFCLIGAYASNNDTFDIGVMIIAGAIGLAMQRSGYPMAPLVLGLVLGPIIERNFMASLQKSESLLPFVTRPVSVLLIVMLIAIAVGPHLYGWIKSRISPVHKKHAQNVTV